MKLTEARLRQIIHEELELVESDGGFQSPGPMTVGKMIAFLETFDRGTVVLINGDSGSPDPIEMRSMYTEWVVAEFDDGTSEALDIDALEDLDEPYKLKSRQPLFWPR